MSDFILYSVIGSIVLTIALNVLPLIFPNAADKLQHKIEENARRSIEQHEDDNQPRVKSVFSLESDVDRFDSVDGVIESSQLFFEIKKPLKVGGCLF